MIWFVVSSQLRTVIPVLQFTVDLVFPCSHAVMLFKWQRVKTVR